MIRLCQEQYDELKSQCAYPVKDESPLHFGARGLYAGVAFTVASTHFIIECSLCAKMIAQCRCPAPNKVKEYQVCQDCKNMGHVNGQWPCGCSNPTHPACNHGGTSSGCVCVSCGEDLSNDLGGHKCQKKQQ